MSALHSTKNDISSFFPAVCLFCTTFLQQEYE